MDYSTPKPINISLGTYTGGATAVGGGLPDPKLPQWVGVKQVQGGGSNPAVVVNELAKQINNQTINVSAQGQIIPLAYGHVRITGSIYALAKSGTDLVLGIGWCIGEIDSIEAIYINNAAADPSVTITNYLGTTTQGVDPLLASLITAYNDSLKADLPTGIVGIAHSVVRIPEAAVGDGFPKVDAVINGRKIIDPRTGTISASANPALIVNDLITNGVFGAGLTATGVAACADWCDSLIGGVLPRCRADIVLSGSSLADLLSLFSDYGEFFYSVDGGTIALIPDAPVDLSQAATYTDASIEAASFSITEASAQDTPTVCEISITQTTTDASAWGSQTVFQQDAGVATGDTPRIPTSLNMPGITRPEEGQVKAKTRLNKLANRRAISLTTMDRGLSGQVGDVVTLQSDSSLAGASLNVRITSVSPSSPGRWRLDGYTYRAEDYATTYDGTGADVPVGLILPLSGMNHPPAGWAIFTDADDHCIYGAGGAKQPGDNAPATPATIAFSGNTSTDGLHGGGAYAVRGKFNSDGTGNLGIEEGTHSHAYTMPAASPFVNPYNVRLAIKTGSVASGVPAAFYAFGIGALDGSGLSKSLALAGRLIAANAAESTPSAGDFSVSFDTASQSFSHDHTQYSSNAGPYVDSGPDLSYRRIDDSGQAHTHQTTAYIKANPIRKRLSMYSAGGSWTIQPGVIGMWSGSIASIPTDWSLCDGTNGTPDLRDAFIEVANASNEGTQTGNNTAIPVALSSESVGHSHGATAYSDTGKSGSSGGHSAVVYHNHLGLTGSQSYTPALYALAFIMYTPGA